MENVSAMSVTGHCDCIKGSWVISYHATFPYIVLQLMFALLALVLNATVFATICCSCRLRSSTHAFIASMAYSDIAFTLHGIAYASGVIGGTRMCYIHNEPTVLSHVMYILANISMTAQYLNVLVVSAERWLYIARPFLHQRFISARVTIAGVVLVWLISFLSNLDGVILSSSEYVTASELRLVMVYPCCHVVATVILCIIYVHLTVIIRKQICAINQLRFVSSTKLCSSTPTIDSRLKCMLDNFKCVRLLVLVFGAFFVLLSPGTFFHLYLNFSSDSHDVVHQIVKLLTISHGAISVCVYTSQDKMFRTVLWGYLLKITCLRKRFHQTRCNYFCHKRVRPTPIRARHSANILTEKFVMSDLPG